MLMYVVAMGGRQPSPARYLAGAPEKYDRDLYDFSAWIAGSIAARKFMGEQNQVMATPSIGVARRPTHAFLCILFLNFFSPNW